MERWRLRAVEEANLFNPAFCAILLAKAADNFAKRASRPLPFPLAFLVLPVVLHRETRLALPHTTITSVLPWVQNNREHLVDFTSRVTQVRDITREALIFGVRHEMLALSESGDVTLGTRRRSVAKNADLFTNEVNDCLDRAAFVGRWFAAAGSTAAIFAAWGVAP
jgi:Family of unknown function (DUF6521)